MKGYFNNPEATAQTLRDGWLHSGDQAIMDEDGCFFFVDRKKDMIKRAGEERVRLGGGGGLEAAPRRVRRRRGWRPGSRARPGHQGLRHPARRASATSEELITWCRARLSGFKVPERVEFRDVFPRTSVGKIQKHLF